MTLLIIPKENMTFKEAIEEALLCCKQFPKCEGCQDPCALRRVIGEKKKKDSVDKAHGRDKL